MMALIIAKAPINLAGHLGRVVSAHQAVRLGIATHVQKEHARRLDEQRKKSSDAALIRSAHRGTTSP